MQMTDQKITALMGADIPELPVPVVQVKRTDKYIIKIPEDTKDLHVQIYFIEPFIRLIETKKIFNIQTEIADKLTALPIAEAFEVDIIKAEKSLYVGSVGFFNSLTSDILPVITGIEEVLQDNL